MARGEERMDARIGHEDTSNSRTDRKTGFRDSQFI